MVGTPESGQVRLGVVIVSYNTKDHLRACLESLGEADEVIVVDNASHDGSPEMVAADFPHIHLIANAKNRGFGAANNQGLDAMTSELALLLNSDATATPGALGVLREVMSRPERGGVWGAAAVPGWQGAGLVLRSAHALGRGVRAVPFREAVPVVKVLFPVLADAPVAGAGARAARGGPGDGGLPVFAAGGTV